MAVVAVPDVEVDARHEQGGPAADGQLRLWPGGCRWPVGSGLNTCRRDARAEDCRQMGAHVIQAWAAGLRPGFDLLDPAALLRLASLMREPTTTDAVGLVASHLAQLGQHSDQSQERLFREVARFVRRLELIDVTTLTHVNATHAHDFVHEAVEQRNGWADPGLGTMHFRRSAVRIFFRAARQLHLVRHDPTLDLALPARSALTTRPLQDDEETLCRVASRQTLIATRLPAAWALGQATAVSSELAAIRVGDVDLEAGTVLLHGCSKREARVGVLTPWGIDQLRRRIEELGDETAPLVYGAQRSPVSGQASACGAIHAVLTHAGLAGERDVRPGSLAAWAGRRVFNETGLEREVAKALGTRSLDHAARAIGWDWSS